MFFVKNIRSCCGLRNIEETDRSLESQREIQLENGRTSIQSVTLKPRRRALSIVDAPTGASIDFPSAAAHQANSGLFSKLPLEIKEHIYELVLFAKRIDRSFYIAFNDYDYRRQERLRNRHTIGTKSNDEVTDLSLMCTCHQTYEVSTQASWDES